MKNPSESSRSNSIAKGSGIIELTKMTTMEAKLDAIMHRMDRQYKRLHSAHEIGAIDREGMRRCAKGLDEEDPYHVEEAKYLNEQRIFQFKPNLNLLTHYNPTLRNHENLSYGGGAIHDLRHGQNYQQGYQQTRFQQQQGESINEYQDKKRAQSFEEQMLQFMGDNKKLTNLHKQKFNELENLKSNIHMFQANTGASLKNLETQVGQLALNMQTQNKGAFPSYTQKNPKDSMTV